MCENLRRNGLRAVRDDRGPPPAVQPAKAGRAGNGDAAGPPPPCDDAQGSLEVRCRCLPWEEMDASVAEALSADIVLGADITCAVDSPCS